jgi:serine/threonine-protein kinase
MLSRTRLVYDRGGKTQVMAQANRNPYDYRLPVRDPEAFFGRSMHLQCACGGIARKEYISFVGEPHSGLTSLLNRLMAQRFHAQCESVAGPLQFIYVDCNLFDEPLPLVRYLLSQVAPDRPMPSGTNWRLAFGRFISALERLQNKRIVIVLDDFEHIGRSELFVDFIDSLRGLAVRVFMTLIVATHIELHRACHKDIASSPFPNIFKVQDVAPFTAEEFSEFLKTTSAASRAQLMPYADNILRLGGRWPYFLQMACAHYYDEVANRGEPDHEAIAERLKAEARPAFEGIWQRLDARAKAVLRDLLAGRSSCSDRSYAELTRWGYIVEGRIFSEPFGQFVRDAA